ncbi:hypothetical protein LB523_10540 [Mesorhizobium sp. ESP-6-4]|uniref:hypothetical protein n=1 Tax=Mesorhizobium sp. ESP-6-4 TaxID=2876624 RepID=UPI001CCADB6B|nr:hypothetical protein [Mesorhizobium sp. ESP-6-4]MBZ9659483.1 hypothetical protein [Mesorhizobium sp. ESP-6-4]
MRYPVHYFQAGRVEWSDINIDDLGLAKEAAIAAVSNGDAERAEVRDESDQLLFQVPRTLRRA